MPIWNVKLMIATASTCQKHKKISPKRSLHLESLQLFFFSTVAARQFFVFFVDDGALTQTWGEKLKFFMGFQVNKQVPFLDLTYPLPRSTKPFVKMIFLFPFGGTCQFLEGIDTCCWQ